ATQARVPALLDRLDAQRKRELKLTNDALPNAISVLRDVEQTETKQLVPITELIQARRAVSELVLEQVDSYSDAFSAALELASVLPPSAQLVNVPRAQPSSPTPTPTSPSLPDPSTPTPPAPTQPTTPTPPSTPAKPLH
ncbi:MAG: hypothetical protein ABI183_16730, partial [Polyangiaceae bacterium]